MAIQIITRTKDHVYDRQMLVEIYEQHHAELYRYAYRLTGDAQLAEDCVSETFSRLLRAVRDGRGPSDNVRAYLFRVAHNWLTDTYRRQPPPPLALEDDLLGGTEGSPAQQVSDQMQAEAVRAALLRLPPDQRQVIELRFLEAWSHEQVAQALGKSLEATRALQHRAIAALRRLLVEQVVV